MEAGALGSGSTESPSPQGSWVAFADRGPRLFELLAESHMVETTLSRTSDTCESVLWMDDLPDHLAVRSAHRVAEPGQPLLAVDRVRACVAPRVPLALASWLDGAADDENDEPDLLQVITNPKPLADDGSDAELVLNDRRDVREAYEQWQPKWAAWAEIECADRPVRNLYASLLSTYLMMADHPEQLELVLGVGCLAGDPAGEDPQLRRHLLTSPAAIALDEESGTLTISAEAGLETLAVELDLADPSLGLNPAIMVRPLTQKSLIPLPAPENVLDSGEPEVAEPEGAVEPISSSPVEDDGYLPGAQTATEDCIAEIDALRRHRGEVRAQLAEARRIEDSLREHGGYVGTLARIAKVHRAQTGQHGWLTDLVTSYPDVPCPLDVERATTWLRLLRDVELVADEAESGHRLVSMAVLPSPAEFASQVDIEAAAGQDAALTTGLTDHAAFAAVAALAPQARSALQSRMWELTRRVGELEQWDESWINDALHEICDGDADRWIARSIHVDELISTTRPIVESLNPATAVTIDGPDDRTALTALAHVLLPHVLAFGPVKTHPDGTPKNGVFTHKVVRQARPLFDAVRVNGHAPTTREHLAAFLAHVDVERRLGALDQAWPDNVILPAEDTLVERLQWHTTQLEQLGHLLEVGRELRVEEANLAQIGLPTPSWNDVASVLTYARLVDAANAADACTCASQPLRLLEATTGAVSTSSDAADSVHELDLAVRARDRDKYTSVYLRLIRLHEVRAMTADRRALTDQVRQAAPNLADAVLVNPAEPAWDERIPSLPSAWDWGCTGAWILEQESSDTEILQAQIDAIETRLHRVCEVLAASRAWDDAVSPASSASSASSARLTGQAPADPSQYAQLVRRVGEGAGKYAVARRGGIRTAMDRSRAAIPKWMMPSHRMAEKLPAGQNTVDVATVGEESQDGLEARFSHRPGPDIDVFGDDEQACPTAVEVDHQQPVEVDQQQQRSSANRNLPDDRYKASWEDPKRPLFEARMRFELKLTFNEYRRGVLEIVPEIVLENVTEIVTEIAPESVPEIVPPNHSAYEPEDIHLEPVKTPSTLEQLGGALHAGDRDAVMSCFAADATLRIVSNEDLITLKGSGIGDGVDALLSGFDNLTVTPTSRHISKQGVVEEAIVSGDHTGVFSGSGPTSQRVSVIVRSSARWGTDSTLKSLSVEADTGALFAQIAGTEDTMGVTGWLIAVVRERGPLRVTYEGDPSLADTRARRSLRFAWSRRWVIAIALVAVFLAAAIIWRSAFPVGGQDGAQATNNAGLRIQPASYVATGRPNAASTLGSSVKSPINTCTGSGCSLIRVGTASTPRETTTSGSW
ncbi:MAG: hypothetical protein QOF35_418 [Actinomycetota bacterium]|nr:hypothetical protein [Actinomycetota bacterium]